MSRLSVARTTSTLVLGVALAVSLPVIRAGGASSTSSVSTMPSVPSAATPPTTDDTNRAGRAQIVRVVAAGDIACPPGREPTRTTCQQAATANAAARLKPSRFFVVGDTQYDDGTLAEYRNSYDASWGRFKGRTHPVPGNHEYHTARASGYYTYFHRKRPGYYTFTLGDWRIVALNSNCDDVDCEREEGWLRGVLSRGSERCTALLMHHARYSSGREHGSDESMRRFWSIGYGHGADVVLAGHDHDYERFAPMNGAGQVRPESGLTSFVVGAGGKSLYHQGRPEVGSRRFFADDFGVLALDLAPRGYSFSYVTIAGVVRDSGSRACH